jgi:hypothetical protein
MACLIALFRIPSMVVSCLSLKTPRCVAWYLDFSSCSIANDLSGGLIFFSLGHWLAFYRL